MKYSTKRYLSLICVVLFSFSIFYPAFAQNTSSFSLDQVNSTKQQLITLLTKLLAELESKLQNLLATTPVVSKPVPAPIVDQTAQSNIMGGTLSAENVFAALKPTDLFISSVSSFVVAPGNSLTIKGHGFLAQNTIHIGNIYSSNVSSQNGIISINTPSLSNGVYEIWVENANGSSQKTSPQYIKISSQSLTRPEIIKSYPQNVSKNSTITVEGSGFDQYNNTINSTLGTIHNVPSNNGKLQFSVSDFSETKKINSSNFPNGMLVTYSVNTSNGQSANYGFFTFSSFVVKNEQGIFGKLITAFNNLFAPLPAFAIATRMYDGGAKDTKGIDTTCTCSGSILLKFDSYFTQQTQYYVYEPGVSTIAGSYIGMMKSGNDYLMIFYPVGICLEIRGEDCENSDNNPDGTINIGGADLLIQSSGGGGSGGGGGQ